ncbi:RNA polymerase archaeal subunit P/eukaryotic subunit RPABC4 protein [Dioscorea alata]|uniref:RNA polymerase archaeal subunit P/eukaryotic subunit RPABC4 protein n=1 Tax=Dioscorea alata TaxID=55571 RepID=A0ACB7VRC9_DIOAL|nr:RNA polymerase archaeal subunit P/eukaryotic subunit RPABC4 protein [Dioscorea alata]
MIERARCSTNLGNDSDDAPAPTPPPASRTSSNAGSGPSRDGNIGINDERILMLVFRSINWDPRVLSVTACVSRRLRAVAKRVLWRELCFSRAPRLVSALTSGAPNARLVGGWLALAKLFFFCCGSQSSGFFPLDHPFPGHFIAVSRFSKTSGKSFLPRRCWGDLLYVSDPCEHSTPAGGDDLGVYRGVFPGFIRSRTRACLINRQAELDSRVRCPYCGARVWSMTAARLIPRSAARRLGSHDGDLEYFVCVYGHLHGLCWLAHLSSDDEGKQRGEAPDEDDDDGDAHDDDDDDDDDDDHIAV